MAKTKDKYLLDANVFIEAHRRYYNSSICPGFWTALLRQHEKGTVASIDRVCAELNAIKDGLCEWVKESAPDSFFKKTDDQRVVACFSDMMQWVAGQSQFTGEAKSEFATAADGWVMAYAKANGLCVVTHEEISLNARRRVPMPNVCRQFGVKYCNTFQMLMDLGEKFVASSKVGK